MDLDRQASPRQWRRRTDAVKHTIQQELYGVIAFVALIWGTLFLGSVLPRLGSHVSWDGHLFGAVAGGIIAYVLTRERRPHEASAGIADEP